MTVNPIVNPMDKYRDLILQAEIAALLHDIGKLTEGFITSKTVSGDSEAGSSYDAMKQEEGHAWSFLKEIENGKTSCNAELLKILNSSLPDKWLKVPDQPAQLKHLGDLIRFHHERGIKRIDKKLKLQTKTALPLLIALIMISDSIDSASSKGGAVFGEEKDNMVVLRQSRLSEDRFLQYFDNTLYLSTPLGAKEVSIPQKKIPKQADEFQIGLAIRMQNYGQWYLGQLINNRSKLIKFLNNQLSLSLADTRQPSNDVSLWQHSYHTASIFKAMLARHLLLKNYAADDKTNLKHHEEKLAFLGVRWRQDDLLSNAVRPKDITGRVDRLNKLASCLSPVVETEFCLGNKIYEDRDGVVFLIPSPGIDDEVKKAVNALVKRLEEVINDSGCFRGDLNYHIVYQDVGIQLLGLPPVLKGEGRSLQSQFLEPAWVTDWKKSKNGEYEICSRCGLRPINLLSVTSGSEADEQKLCGFCVKIQKVEGHQYYSREDRIKLFGIPESGALTFETDELVSREGENKRVALVQGLFDLRPFLSGEAFSSILARRPEDYHLNGGEEDRSPVMSDWPSFLSSLNSVWKNLKENKWDNEILHTFQQAFHDTYLGTLDDGRVSGKSPQEKLINYINEIVLTSPFPPGLEDHQKIALYSLRQHPAPSRIARVWETTEQFNRDALGWCETNGVKWFPLTLDPGRFMVLIPANKAWEFLQNVYTQYEKVAGRVRHLLPLHLSATVFYYKAPLYVGIDAMRRFADINLSQTNPVPWELVEKSRQDDFYHLTWRDHRRRLVTWKIPVNLPNGKPDHYYTWFWVESRDRPYLPEEMEPGMRAFIRPSTFDYEVLDTTTRRYDIRVDGEEVRRPHLFCGASGPRPYPLSYLDKWKKLMEHDAWQRTESHQIHRLIQLLGGLHLDWRRADPDILATQAADYLNLCLGGNTEEFREPAVSGALFDLFEWEYLIKQKEHGK